MPGAGGVDGGVGAGHGERTLQRPGEEWVRAGAGWKVCVGGAQIEDRVEEAALGLGGREYLQGRVRGGRLEGCGIELLLQCG